MNKIIKLISLIALSLSVYFIYNNTDKRYYYITNIGDKLSTGINSYGIKEKSYIDYYKDYLNKEKIIIDNTYSKKTQTISNMLQLIEDSPTVKRKLINSNVVIITLGYNDLLYNINIEEKNNFNRKKILYQIKNNYNMFIKEIRKYYHKDIIVIGYYQNNKDSYLNEGIIKLNEILKNNKEIHYIDTYHLLKNRKKYFGNYNSYYPNSNGYYEISKKIISKTLEIS